MREILVRRFGVSDSKLSHGRLSSDLQHSSLGEEVRNIGRELERLYRFRRFADYVLDPMPNWAEMLGNAEMAQANIDRAVLIANTVHEVDFTSAARLLASR